MYSLQIIVGSAGIVQWAYQAEVWDCGMLGFQKAVKPFSNHSTI